MRLNLNGGTPATPEEAAKMMTAAITAIIEANTGALRQENEWLRAEMECLRAENQTLKAELLRVEGALATT